MGPAWPEDQRWGQAWVSASRPALTKASTQCCQPAGCFEKLFGVKKEKALGQGGHTKQGRSCFSVQRAQVSPSGRVDSSFTLPGGPV